MSIPLKSQVLLQMHPSALLSTAPADRSGGKPLVEKPALRESERFGEFDFSNMNLKVNNLHKYDCL
jgi:hypothetical protein